MISDTNILKGFFEMLTNLKMLHWATSSLSVHTATDSLHSSMSNKIDKFIEVLQGSKHARLSIKSGTNIKLQSFSEADSNQTLIELLTYYQKWINKSLTTKNQALKNIVDEMLADVNKTIFLASLN